MPPIWARRRLTNGQTLQLMRQRMERHRKMATSPFAPYREKELSYDMGFLQRRHPELLEGSAAQYFDEMEHREAALQESVEEDRRKLERLRAEPLQYKAARRTRKTPYDLPAKGSPTRYALSLCEDFKPKMREVRSVSAQFRPVTGRWNYGVVRSNQRVRIGGSVFDLWGSRQ